LTAINHGNIDPEGRTSEKVKYTLNPTKQRAQEIIGDVMNNHILDLFRCCDKNAVPIFV